MKLLANQKRDFSEKEAVRQHELLLGKAKDDLREHTGMKTRKENKLNELKQELTRYKKLDSIKLEFGATRMGKDDAWYRAFPADARTMEAVALKKEINALNDITWELLQTVQKVTIKRELINHYEYFRRQGG